MRKTVRDIVLVVASMLGALTINHMLYQGYIYKAYCVEVTK